MFLIVSIIVSLGIHHSPSSFFSQIFQLCHFCLSSPKPSSCWALLPFSWLKTTTTTATKKIKTKKKKRKNKQKTVTHITRPEELTYLFMDLSYIKKQYPYNFGDRVFIASTSMQGDRGTFLMFICQSIHVAYSEPAMMANRSRILPHYKNPCVGSQPLWCLSPSTDLCVSWTEANKREAKMQKMQPSPQFFFSNSDERCL